VRKGVRHSSQIKDRREAALAKADRGVNWKADQCQLFSLQDSFEGESLVEKTRPLPHRLWRRAMLRENHGCLGRRAPFMKPVSKNHQRYSARFSRKRSARRARKLAPIGRALSLKS
jgi:hypothetical protein